MFFSKLLLIVTLCHMVLNGESLDNNGDSCDKSQAKTVRLQGLTKYAGRAEICWNMDNDEYRWFNVCSYSWSMSKTRDICEQLNYFNTIIDGMPYPCSDNSCKSFPLVSVDCKSRQDCRNKSIILCSGLDKKLIFITCDTATLIPTLINYVAMGTEDAGEANAITGLGIALGLMIIIVALMLVGVFLGLAWCFQRKLRKTVLKKEIHTIEYEENQELSSSESQSNVNTHHMQSMQTADQPHNEENTNAIYSEIDDIKMTTVKNSQADQLERPEATGELYEAINGLLKILEELRDNGEGNIEERITDKEQFHIYTSLVGTLLEENDYCTMTGRRND